MLLAILRHCLLCTRGLLYVQMNHCGKGGRDLRSETVYTPITPRYFITDRSNAIFILCFFLLLVLKSVTVLTSSFLVQIILISVMLYERPPFRERAVQFVGRTFSL